MAPLNRYTCYGAIEVVAIIIIIIIISVKLIQICYLTYEIHIIRARAVVKAPKFSHITPILKSLHRLKVNKRIEHKLLSLAYKVLTTSQP